MRPRRMALVALALSFLTAAAAPWTAAAPVRAVGPLPACELKDVLTEPRGYDDWRVTLVDWQASPGPV